MFFPLEVVTFAVLTQIVQHITDFMQSAYIQIRSTLNLSQQTLNNKFASLKHGSYA